MKRIRLLTESILGSFANSVEVHRNILHRVWIVAPWIGSEAGKTDPVLQLVDTLRDSPRAVTVITRKPTDAWHLTAVQLLQANVKPVVYYCATLHTKLYIMECNGLRSAILGSPNLTGKANRTNREIAVEFRATSESVRDDVAVLLTELVQYASDLRGISELA